MLLKLGLLGAAIQPSMPAKETGELIYTHWKEECIKGTMILQVCLHGTSAF